MLYSRRIHVSEGNDVNETSESKDCNFVTVGISKVKFKPNVSKSGINKI